jgi:hypothetical protein
VTCRKPATDGDRFGERAPDQWDEIGSQIASIGGKPGGTADLDELSSGTWLHEKRLNDSAIVRPQVTDDLGYAAAPACFLPDQAPDRLLK